MKWQESILIPVALKYEPVHDKTNKLTYAPSEDSAQLGHPPSLIRAFAWLFLGS